MKKETITVIGSGYVGTTTAALLSFIGYRVYVLDIDQGKLDVIRSGRSPFYETGLDTLIEEGIKSNRLTPTDSYKEAIQDSRIVISSVGTPERGDGSPNLDYIFSVVESIAKVAKKKLIFIQKSTVPAGTGREVISRYKELSQVDIAYVSVPEFLRESTAIQDSIEPDRIVVGGDEIDVNNQIIDMFYAIYKRRNEISRVTSIELEGKEPPEVFNTSLESAELSKVAANAFLALKISYANSMALLSERVGANISEVMNIVGSDKRIGRAFLNAGRGYGGGCFPKDVKGLIDTADKNNISLDIIKSSARVNDHMIDHIANKVGNVENKKIGIIGLAFKSGTSDVRESPGIRIANNISDKGGVVYGYDPKANQSAKPYLRDNIILLNDLLEIIKLCDVIVIATDWSEFLELNTEIFRGKILIDGMNMLDLNKFKAQGIEYIGVGR